ncbi:sensor histidine kinase [Peredibacter starrii]|uniref:histidine kinase n=1 Tax=Peredibacter starrii TaxID=28202 RepID=A0AAX4HKB4_9BACT|nr:ATP-binding protein [Peredibacter starrii]WPU63670.1 ATP-binding protein [Peredibacter starrii]
MNSATIIINISFFTVVGMIIISSIIYWYERDKRQWEGVEYWLANGTYFLVTAITNKLAPSFVALSTVLWIWRFVTSRKILESVTSSDLKRKWHMPLILGGYFLSLLFNQSGFEFLYYTLPQSLALFIVATDCLVRARKILILSKTVSITHYLLFGTLFIVFLHHLDYGFFRFNPATVTFGFGVSLMCNILMAILLPSVTIYELRMEHQRKLETKLEMQSKFSALGEMAAGIAHEINNPLGLISTRANYLRNHIQRGSAEKDFIVRNLDQIEETTQRMATIINSLRSFSRDNRKEPFKTVTPGLIIEDTLNYSRDRFRMNSIQIIVDPFPQVDLVCRPIQISQVLLNLMNNSFDAIVKTDRPWIHLTCEVFDHTLRIKVIDSGKGIPKEVLKNIMEPFFTTKEMGGTGIGLSISRGIIEDHHGKLYYDESSTNTAFVVELPLQQNEV